MERLKKDLETAKEQGDRAAEGCAYHKLGHAYHDLGDSKQAIEYHKQHLSIAKELGDRAGERCPYHELGHAYHDLGDFKQAIEYHKQHLSIAKELGDRTGEGHANNDLGSAYHKLADSKQAIEYHNQHLSIAKELGDRKDEGRAYHQLGLAYQSLGDFKQAIDYQKQHLSIAKELEDRAAELCAYLQLACAYHHLGDFKETIEYLKQQLSIAKELGDRAKEGCANKDIGCAYSNLGDFKQAIEYHKQHLSIAKELGDRAQEGCAYHQLGHAYRHLGDFKETIDCHKQDLSIAKELGDRAKEGCAYHELGQAYHDLRDFKQAIEYHKQHLSIAQELRDKAEEGHAYSHIGSVYHTLGDLKKAIEYQQQGHSIVKELGDKRTERCTCTLLGDTYRSLGDFKQAIECHKHSISLMREMGQKCLEGLEYHSLGLDLEKSGALQEAIDYYQRRVKVNNELRALLQYEDAWKISFRNVRQGSYTGLWRTLVKLSQFEEALCAAEQGRAQALVDLMELQYGSELSLSETFEPKAVIYDIISDVSSPTLFVALEGSTIHLWVLYKGKNMQFKQNDVKEQCEDADFYLEDLREKAFKEIRNGAQVICENRSLSELREEDKLSPIKETSGGTLNSSQSKRSSLRLLHEYIIGPVSDLLEGDELVVVPDGPLCLAPFAAFLDSESKYLSESVRIRILPSLTSLKLIAASDEDYHKKSGVLLVGDPCLDEVTDLLGIPFFTPLLNARKEVEIIGEMLGVPPLTGKEATKAEVLRQIASVAVVHIAAHGKIETGEIALAPNPTGIYKTPEKTDYMLTASDVQAAKLRAKLVVLSCCHSAQGKVSAEGVVGIARAFLGAGARSVLASLWAIDDEATMVFMRIFYNHLKDGNSASVSLHRARNYLRESEEFSAVRYWAPFVLIGDDVTIEFEDK